MALAFSFSTAALAQGGLDLPPYRGPDLAAALSRGDFASAVATGVDTDGDRMALDLAVSVRAVAAATAGLDAEIVAVDGGYEIAVDPSVAAGIGIDAFRAIAIDAEGGYDEKVVFRWPTKAEAAHGLELIATARQTSLIAMRDLLRSQLDLVVDAADALRESVARTAAARATHAALDDALAAATRELRHLQSEAHRLDGLLGSAERSLAHARHRLSHAPRWVRSMLRGPVRIAEHAVAVLRGQGGPVHAALQVAEATTRGAADAAEGARQALDECFRQEGADRRLYESAQEVAHHTQTLMQGAAAVGDQLISHLVRVELTVAGTVEAEAALRPSGVELENVGTGLSGAVCLGVRIAYGLTPEGGERLSASASYDLTMDAWAGMGVGFRAEAAAGLTIDATWLRAPGARAFAFDDLTTTLHGDLAVFAVGGAGLAVEHGIGRSVSLEMNAAQWQRASRSVAALGGFTSTHLITALRGIQATERTQDRWEDAIVVGIGGAVWSGSGRIGWQDQGFEHVRVVDASQLASEMLGTAWRATDGPVLAAGL